jgi:Raf kinase inhibitor-like YbhB/YbcL family protein
MQVSSAAFANGGTITKLYTGDGRDVSPPVQWSGAPAGVKGFALICDDPDAPRKDPWVHWVLFNLPSESKDLPEGVPTTGSLPSGAKQGKNDFGNLGYGGPAPPPGKPHRYNLKLYALDSTLDLSEGATKPDVEKAMKGHVVGQGHLMGTYGR